MIQRQRGALNLIWVGVVSALLALAAMAALYSMRYERNLFAEALAKVTGSAPARQAIDAAQQAVAAAKPGDGAAAGNGALRKCVIDGKTVVSNVECLDSNKTSKAIKIVDTRGVEAPKMPAAPAASATSDPAIDKIVEKQLH
jgi:hypothetical protein